MLSSPLFARCKGREKRSLPMPVSGGRRTEPLPPSGVAKRRYWPLVAGDGRIPLPQSLHRRRPVRRPHRRLKPWPTAAASIGRGRREKRRRRRRRGEAASSVRSGDPPARGGGRWDSPPSLSSLSTRTHVAHGYESGNSFCLKSRSFFLPALLLPQSLYRTARTNTH